MKWIELLPDYWDQQPAWLYLLAPLSLLFFIAVWLRRWAYRLKLKKTTKFPVPVIIVGNITVGGTGKTPMVIWLAEYLKQQGHKPGLVSRGYGGKAEEYPLLVTAESDPTVVGDEALVLVQRTHCPMAVAPDRVVAVQCLLEQSDCDVVISDDGLQHYALSRDLEIAVVDAARGLGNGFLLPAGPLREPQSRLREVDAVVVNGRNMHLHPETFVNLKQPGVQQAAEYFFNKNVRAIAGIGNPKRFFQTLTELGIKFGEHPFPDHHHFTAEDLDFAVQAAILMTEKDAVKCKHLADERFWYLQVKAQLQPQLQDRLQAKIAGLFA